MDPLQLKALQRWHDVSHEGLLVVDVDGQVRLANSRFQELFKLSGIPRSVDDLLRQTRFLVPELPALLTFDDHSAQTRWGSLRMQGRSAGRLNWQQEIMREQDQVQGLFTIFRDTTALVGQPELDKQAFLSMISHDLRTPLSTILGFAELLSNNRASLSDAEQTEFLGHIIKNANQLSRYTQIALDIMYLEANLQDFELHPVLLPRFVKHWLSDACHRFPAQQLVLQNDAPADLSLVQIAPAALHKILFILAEFSLTESPADIPVTIRLNQDNSQAHILLQHQAPNLHATEIATLFRLMNPRDLSEAGRPQLHRMQLYVAHLLAERQQGDLTLRAQEDNLYQIDLALALAPPDTS
jgi:signal transduction histidine kinase